MTTRTRMNRHSLRPGTSGAALILVLLAILALSALVVLFFSLASVDRTNSSVYAQGLKANELAYGGLELVIEKLREEIVDPSRSTLAESTPPGIGPAIYIPTSPSHLLPDATVTTSATTPSNLLKISSRSHPISLLTSGTTLASAASTATLSRNGRSIPMERWNKPELAVFDSGTGAPVPDWVYFKRNGPVVNPGLPDAANEASEAFVTGRVAFAVYDVGGLIDINVAGYPASVPSADAGRKGTPAFGRLESLGISPGAREEVLKFRNPSSAATAADFLLHLQNFSLHQAFTRTVSGDNRFLSRQELIRFARKHGFQAQLPMLTVFAREKNAPTFAPQSPSPVNPSLAMARHTASGRLLFEKRFPLNKLTLITAITANPSDAVLAAELKEYFGLQYNDDAEKTFTYVGPESGAADEIKTLAQIAAEPVFRIPNFFETLKAAIAQGSLGASAGPDAADAPEGNTDDSPDAQVVQIAANIMDQFDGDDLPTAIHSNISSVPAWGVENLPYVNKVMFLGERDSGNASVGSNNPQGPGDNGFRIGVELWNPHLQKLPPTSTPGRQIRVRLGPSDAATRVDVYKDFHAEDLSTRIQGDPAAVGGYAVIINETDTWMHSTADWDDYRYFAEPSIVRLGKANANLINTPERYYSALCVTSGMYVELAVFDGTGYRTYQRTYPIDGSLLYTKENTAANSASTLRGASAFVRSDPRTNRGGAFQANFRPASNTIPSYPAAAAPNGRSPWSLRRDESISGPGTTEHDPTSGYTPASAPFYLGLLYENTQSATQMRDPDGEIRHADGGFISGGLVPTEPIFNFNGFSEIAPNPSRPIILNRAFRNVGELGYAFRDSPWKSLNFSSTDSADAALLDVFSLDSESVHAGKINLNTHCGEALAAFLSGSLRVASDGDSAIDETQAKGLASAIVTATRASDGTPLENIADVVQNLSTSDFLSPSALGSLEARSIKAQRESVIRSLSGSTQTRTWNLLIDLVAQSGRFSLSARSLDDFLPESERRCWLHVAIDRYTGEIIDEQIEMVQE